MTTPNQVQFKTDDSIDEAGIKVSIFDEKGQPVLHGWQEFLVTRTPPGSNGPWDPAEYGAPVTPFYIGKGVLQGERHHDNDFVAGAILVNFDSSSDGTITIGAKLVPCCNGSGPGCWVFTASASGVEIDVLEDGTTLIPGTQVPSRCRPEG